MILFWKVCSKAIEAFNSNYNLNLTKENLLNNLYTEAEVQAPTEEMANLSINDTCIAIKRNKENCCNKALPDRMYCGTHIRSEGKLSLDEHVKTISKRFNYEVTAKVVSLGNQWFVNSENQNNHSNNSQWLLEIKNKKGSINSYILFFTEFSGCFGAGIFVIQYLSSDKKESYFMATHYVEVNKYGESLKSHFYVKIAFKSISSLEGKPIFKKIKSFLAEYGIPYNVNDISKRKTDISENNPVVVYNQINKIIDSHYNTMFFTFENYINSNVNEN
ncbi:hypothetical protein H8356DRAFT_1293724 [Neocallimastix lanati (nom. inval.)]|nr:hypothetical protein H8356DRAFT_1293724 [Neocallimastix sp. JGI-2020a]